MPFFYGDSDTISITRVKYMEGITCMDDKDVTREQPAAEMDIMPPEAARSPNHIKTILSTPCRSCLRKPIDDNCTTTGRPCIKFGSFNLLNSK